MNGNSYKFLKHPKVSFMKLAYKKKFDAHEFNKPEGYSFLQEKIQIKFALNQFYIESYHKFKQVINRSPKEGLIVEIGSGVGFIKKEIPEIITTDIISYPNVDQVVDARHLPFCDNSVKTFCLLNSFHHISDIHLFLNEVERTLKPKGRIMIIDHHHSPINHIIFKFFHHEKYDPQAINWSFNSLGPYSDSNAALAWIVFQRDLEKFKEKYPKLRLIKYSPHTPLSYWLSGGLMKEWSLIHKWNYNYFKILDSFLTKTSNKFSCFVDIELEKS